MSRRLTALLLVVLVYIAPVLLVYTQVVPTEYRFVLLGVMVAVVLVLARVQGMSLRTLGFRTDNLRASANPYLFFTAGGVGILTTLTLVLGKEVLYTVPVVLLIVLVALPISAAQEFLYRSYLFPLLRQLSQSVVVVVVVNAALFALLHIIYANLVVVLPLTFVAGIGFAFMYQYYPNVILITLSHTMLNAYAVAFGFITLT